MVAEDSYASDADLDAAGTGPGLARVSHVFQSTAAASRATGHNGMSENRVAPHALVPGSAEADAVVEGKPGLSRRRDDSAPGFDKARQRASSHTSTATTGSRDLVLTPQILILYMIVVCDAMALTIVFPFLPGMARDRFMLSEQETGTVVGMLVGSYNFARFLSSFYLGHLSDRHGRKALLLLGLASSLVTMIVFAVAQTWQLALAARVFGGLLNSNSGIAASCLTDMTIGPARTQAMAFLGASFALARSLSSATSSLLTEVHINSEPFLSNPYLFPISVGSLVLFVVFIIAFFFFRPESAGVPAGTVKVAGEKPSLRRGLEIAVRSPSIRRLLVMGGFTAWCNGSSLLGIVLLASAPVDRNGFGYRSFGTGMMLAYFGAAAFAFQVTYSKRVMARLGLRRTFVAGNVCQCVAVTLLSLSGLAYDPASTLASLLAYLLMLSSIGLVAVGFMMALPTLSAMISNASVPEQVGLIQGSSQSIQSLCRAVGPFISGIIFGATVSSGATYVMFLVLAVVYAWSAFIAAGLHADVEESEVIELSATGFVLAGTSSDDDDGGVELGLAHAAGGADDDGDDSNDEDEVVFQRGGALALHDGSDVDDD